jgi:hypothetical protein
MVIGAPQIDTRTQNFVFSCFATNNLMIPALFDLLAMPFILHFLHFVYVVFAISIDKRHKFDKTTKSSCNKIEILEI